MPSQSQPPGASGPRPRKEHSPPDQRELHSLSRVPRVPLIVASSLLVALLTFLTVRLSQEPATRPTPEAPAQSEAPPEPALPDQPDQPDQPTTLAPQDPEPPTAQATREAGVEDAGRAPVTQVEPGLPAVAPVARSRRTQLPHDRLPAMIAGDPAPPQDTDASQPPTPAR